MALYCIEDLQIRRRSDVEDPNIELLWAEVQAGNQKIMLGCCYRPPEEPVGYWGRLEQNIEQATSGPQSMTSLVGDFNVDYLDVTSATTRPQRQIMQRFNLQNFAVSPTRVTSHSASLLDLMLSTGDIDGACQTAYVNISDHNAIIAHLILPEQHRRQATTHKRCRNLHCVDWNAFNADLS